MAFSAKDLAQYLGKTITLRDARTGAGYAPAITNAREAWGKLRLEVEDSGIYFEPTPVELDSI